MLNTVETIGSLPRSPLSEGEYCRMRSPCSTLKVNLVEGSLDVSSDVEPLQLSQPSSLTSSGRGLGASAADSGIVDKSVVATGEEDGAFASRVPTSQPPHRSNSPATVSSTAPMKGESIMSCDSPIGCDHRSTRCGLQPILSLMPPHALNTTNDFNMCSSPLQRSASPQQRGRLPSCTSSLHSPSVEREPLPSFISLESTPVSQRQEAQAPRKESPVPLKDEDEEDACCICLEEYTCDNPMFRGACQHHFHLPCLMEWKQRSNSCPMCCAETLRDVGEFEVTQRTTPVSSEEAERQRSATRRDAEIAHKLQHKYLLQAQRRVSQDVHAAHITRLLHALQEDPQGVLTGRRASQVSGDQRTSSSTFPTSSNCRAHQSGRVVRVSSSREVRQPERTPRRLDSGSTFSWSNASAQPNTQTSRSSRSKKETKCVVM